HLRDTEVAGRGLVRRSAAEILAREAPDRVRDLESWGVRFDADRFGRLALGLEGGHSLRRVVHAGGSATGRRVVRQLSARAVAEVLPRDEVSRAIQARLEETKAQSVGLDMRAIDPAHFPNVVAALREAGLDPTRQLVPVAPAAHYMMGGIVTDLDAGSTLAGL